MDIPRTERGLLDFVAAREMFQEKPLPEILVTAATTARTNWRQRRTAVVAAGAMTAIGLIVLGATLLKKPSVVP